MHHHDPLCAPGTQEGPEERLARALALARTPGELYVLKRGIPLAIAHEAGVRYDPDLDGRPAVVVPMRGARGALLALHARYLHVARGQERMLTFGSPGGAIGVSGGWDAEPLIFVEGLFDALSFATCGWGSVATIGRWAPWLGEVARGRGAWIAFDTGRPGNEEAARIAERLPGADVRRMHPPPRCKDWNTALVKRGPEVVAAWIRERFEEDATRDS